MEIYAGTRRDINKGYWMSFENHPRLEDTKKYIYARCLPCLENLHEQLKESPQEIALENPLNCWKVVVVLRDLDECLELLHLYQEEGLREMDSVRGRIGTSDKNSPNVVIIFQMLSEDERDTLITHINQFAPQINPDYTISYERGCGDLYGALCGDWQNWQPVTPVKNPHLIPIIQEKIQKLLRGDFHD